MTQSMYLTLPVKDLAQATRLYEAIGCTINPQFSGDTSSCMVWSDTITFMLTTGPAFQEFTPKAIADSKKATEAIIGLTYGERADVDRIVAAATSAGGKADPRVPIDMGWMFNRAFEDADGHMFEAIWLDMTATPQA